MVGVIVKIGILFLLAISPNAYDFTAKCASFGGMWYYGSCYVYFAGVQNWTKAMTTCNSVNTSLATVYSEQQAALIYKYFLPKMSNVSTRQIWLSARNTGSNYQFFQYSNLTNGIPATDYPIGTDNTYWNVNGTGTCVYMQNSTDGSVHFYDGNCSTNQSYICQYYSKFVEKSCDSSLQDAPGVVNMTTTANSSSLCTLDCSIQTWCAGANYNTLTQQCELCTVNTYNFTNTANLTTITMVPNPCWSFYERNTCDIPGQKC